MFFWGGGGSPARPVRIRAAHRQGPAYGAPVAFGEASLVAWALALLAPSSGAMSAWGLWGAPLYLWLGVAPLFVYLGLLARRPTKPL